MKYRNEHLQKLAQRINALSDRERFMVALTFAALLLVLWDFMLLGSQLTHRTAVHTELTALQAEQTIAGAQRDQLTQTLQLDPNAQEKLRLERYTQEINRIDEILKTKAVEFVTPQQMVEVLETLIDKEPGLQLLSLESIDPSKPLEKGAVKPDKSKASVAPSTQQAGPNVYVHGLELNLKGDYVSIVSYVRQLEALSWRFNWSFMSVVMNEWPKAEVKIRLETLSLTEGWIGA
jgi:MSHA biogenesis protein MshJ